MIDVGFVVGVFTGGLGLYASIWLWERTHRPHELDWSQAGPYGVPERVQKVRHRLVPGRHDVDADGFRVDYDPDYVKRLEMDLGLRPATQTLVTRDGRRIERPVRPASEQSVAEWETYQRSMTRAFGEPDPSTPRDLA